MYLVKPYHFLYKFLWLLELCRYNSEEYILPLYSLLRMNDYKLETTRIIFGNVKYLNILAAITNIKITSKDTVKYSIYSVVLKSYNFQL